MSRLRQIILNVRVLIVLVTLLIAIYALAPNPFRDGATIRAVEKGSAAADAGIISPQANEQPSSRERVLLVGTKTIGNADDYYQATGRLPANRTIQVKTSKGSYRLLTKYANQSNATADIGLKVYDAPKTNIRKGLDLQGGTRVLMKPAERIPSEDLGLLLDNMKNRLNVFGLTDVVVREATDLAGNQYILVEIAGVNEEEVKNLLSRQGKFEAKVSNRTVFRGGQDITYVCRSAECSGIDPQRGCTSSPDGWFCGFRFSITLSQSASERQAEATKNLAVTLDQGDRYLNESLELYLDDQLVDSLRIGAELKGKPVTDVQISGSGGGATQQEAIKNSLESMRRLQTILITGSLPVKLEITKTDSITPLVGERFTQNALLMALVAAAAVGIVLFIQYRKITVAVPILLVSLMEVVIMLGIAAIIGWNIDLAAVAGIIAAVGTGVNDQIIITDEALRGEARKIYSWKDKIKSAFVVIFGAFFTLVVAMIPLFFAGAGLLRGFALTTIIGISVGVFITRPAYANILEILLKD
ncbi:hypothetical protein HYY74_06510 [Candidatus Woesearchaeota archaeon]|nr:hypothetical protein [Candidatus Woesearchaeota archaeon]